MQNNQTKTYTIGEWIDIWLTDYAPHKRANSTIKIYGTVNSYAQNSLQAPAEMKSTGNRGVFQSRL